MTEKIKPIIFEIKKKPIKIKGFQLEKDHIPDYLFKITNSSLQSVVFKLKDRKVYTDGRYFTVETLEGNMECEIGDWILIGLEEEIYPCKKDIFNKTYDIVKEIR